MAHSPSSGELSDEVEASLAHKANRWSQGNLSQQRARNARPSGRLQKAAQRLSYNILRFTRARKATGSSSRRKMCWTRSRKEVDLRVDGPHGLSLMEVYEVKKAIDA